MKKWLLLILLSLNAYADLSTSNYVTSHDIVEKNQRFAVIEAQLNSHQLSYYGIEEKVGELKQIQDFTIQCSLQKEKMISHIDYLKKNAKFPLNSVDEQQRLSEQKRAHSVTDLVSCQNLFFKIENTLEKADDLLNDAKNYRYKQNRRPNIVEILAYKDIFGYSLTLKPFEKIFFIKLEQNELKELILRAMMGLIVAFFGVFICRRLAKRIKHHDIKYVLLKLPSYLPLFLPTLLAYYYLYGVYVDTLEQPQLLNVLLVLISYMLIRFLLECFFHTHLRKKNIEWVQKIRALCFTINNIFFISGILRFFVLNSFQHNPLENVVVLICFVSVISHPITRNF